jgi:lipoprotein-anchoring transpeptidase ErfK/SrfK
MPPATIPPTPIPPPPTTPTPIPATQFARVIKVSNVALRTSPSSTATIVRRVPHGQIAGLISITTSGYWYKATYRGKTGYAPVSRFQKVTLVGGTLALSYARVIVVARVQQHVEVWDHQRLMLISAITTGRPELPTPLGTTYVLKKQSPHLFQSPWAWPSIYWYPPGWADFAVLFRSGGYYFHDTHYRPENGFGIGTNVPHIDPDGVERTGSRGCANTPYWAVRMLYGWTLVGDRVVVLDK